MQDAGGVSVGRHGHGELLLVLSCSWNLIRLISFSTSVKERS